MLHKVKTLKNYSLHAVDGEIGKVKEFYFDDLSWTIRYLVVDTGNWLIDRQVLISPHALLSSSLEQKYISTKLTKKQIEDSPLIATDMPVSKQFEEAYHEYYGWPTYFFGQHFWGCFPDTGLDIENLRRQIKERKTWNFNLRSTLSVTGHYIQATDGDVGHVEDFIIDDKSWEIRYLVINTHNWLPGEKVLLSPKLITHISWIESNVYINLSRESILYSKKDRSEGLLNQEEEAELALHHIIIKEDFKGMHEMSEK